MTLGLFNFAAPVGGTLGCLLIGIFIQWAEWRWFFFFQSVYHYNFRCQRHWFGCRAILGTVFYIALWLVLPPDTAVDKEGNVDWFGASLGLVGLVLFNFVWKYALTLSS
jgi:MFS family permease